MQGANSYLGLFRWRQRRKHNRVIEGQRAERGWEGSGGREREGTAACGLGLSVLGESSLSPVRTETYM